MPQKKVTEKEIAKLKSALLNIVVKQKDKNNGRRDASSPICRIYSTGSITGRQIYESFTDEQLLDYLRIMAKEKNHSPAQKEVFWVMRDYIKLRFGKWPYALKAAGLSPAAGEGGRSYSAIQEDLKKKETLLRLVREHAYKTGKLPHPRELPEVCRDLKKYYNNWGDVLKAANIDGEKLNQQCVYRIENLEPEYEVMLNEIRKKAYEMGRVPVHKEIDRKIRHALSERCGSWRNALYQIGLSPVIKMRPFQGSYIDYRKEENQNVHTNSLNNCFYQVLNLSEEDKALLELLKEKYRKTKKVPLKKDVSKEHRQQLLRSCGSWGNAMYQIGIPCEEYYTAVKDAKSSTGIQKKMKGKKDV